MNIINTLFGLLRFWISEVRISEGLLYVLVPFSLGESSASIPAESLAAPAVDCGSGTGAVLLLVTLGGGSGMLKGCVLPWCPLLTDLVTRGGVSVGSGGSLLELLRFAADEAEFPPPFHVCLRALVVVEGGVATPMGGGGRETE